jgi:ELWxxDGT repeat protein
MRKLLAAAGVLCTIHVYAQAPYLVTDLNTSFTPTAESSLPKSFTESNGSVYFSAATAAAGTELFKTNGVTAQLVKDLRPGAGGSGPASFVDLGNGTFVFSAADDTHGRELWISDGTEGGTALVKDILPGSGSSSVVPLVRLGSRAFLSTSTGLWITDGLEAGTQLLATVSTSSLRFTVFNGIFYFSSGESLWRSDGSAGGTFVVKSGIAPRNITATADRLFLAAWDVAHGYELWTSDGTEAGTTIIKDINAGAGGSFNTSSTITMGLIGSAVVFFASDGAHALSLWRSDGTDAGTLLYHEFANTSTSVAPSLQSAAGVAFFTLTGSLWRTDATDAGTFSLPDAISAYAMLPTPALLYFVARDASNGYRLWKSDGSPVGTVKIAPAVGIGEADPQLRYAGGKLYFAGSTGTTGIEPWTSDGTAAGTVMLANLMADPPASANPAELTAASSLIFFIANDGTAPSQLWRSDGTAAGTVKLTQFPDIGYTTLSGLTAWNGQLFFRHGQGELWRSDGTAAGTVLVKQVSVGTLVPASNYLYFASAYYPYGVWRTDGTAAGTIQVSGTYSSALIGEIAGRLYFTAEGYLWSTEGTAESTVKVANLGYLNTVPVIMGGAIYYSSTSDYPNYELWKNDGTPEGSSRVKDIRVGTPGSNPHDLTPAGSLLYFMADNGTSGDELWRSDGTEAGTFLLKDILPGAGSSTPTSMVALNGLLYFAINNGIDGYELWKSDGTVAGTAPVADIAPGSTSSDPQELTVADSKVWFSASNPASGAELWSSDGTAAGTTMVADIEPGSGSSSPGEMTQAGRSLYFSASTSAGRELWALHLAASAFSISDARIVEQDSGSQALRFTVTRTGDLSQAATIAFATANGTATAGADYTARSGSLSFGIGVISLFVDVQVLGDDLIEQNESFFVSISSPSSGVIEDNSGTGTIEDDDRTSALSVGFVQDSYSQARRIVVTNGGPSSATNVELRYVESPASHVFNSYYGSGCVSSEGTVVCTLETLLPGESRTIDVSRYWDYAGGIFYDHQNPPGTTATATVTGTEFDPNLADNKVTRMFSADERLMTPAFLVAGTSAAAEYLSAYVNSSPTSVTLTSTNAIVAISPDPATIPGGQRAATFSLQVGNAAGTTMLSTSVDTAMVIPIVMPGGTPKLDVMFNGPTGYSTSLRYGQDIVIPVHVLARTFAGALPTGIVQLLDETGAVVTQGTLDATATITFTRSGLLPGTYIYGARYAGDANFNPLTVTFPSYTMRGWQTSTSVILPRVICGNTAEVMIVVSTQDSTTAPTGQVKLTLGNEVLTLNLVPGQGPGTSKATAQVSLPQAYYYLPASYIPTGTFDASSGYDYLPAVGGCSPIGLSATATATNRVALTWNPTGAASYEVHRSDYYNNSLQFLGYATTNGYVDTQAQPDHTYIYRVRPTGGAMSEPDIATTFLFLNDPLVPRVTTIRATHLLQLRTATNFARTTGRLPLYVAIAPAPAISGAIRPAHIQELRNAIDEARRYLGVLPVTYTDPVLTPGMPVKAIHIQELRNALK